MDIGAFNVFAALNKSLIKSSYKVLTAGSNTLVIPAGVRKISAILIASGGGAANGTTNGAGGAACTVCIRDMPILPGITLSAWYWDGSTFTAGPPPGGAAGAPAGNGVDGKPLLLVVGDYKANYASTSNIIVAPGKGGLTSGVGGAGGGVTNALTAGGGKAAGVSVNPETEWLNLLSQYVIRVQGAGGGNYYTGAAYPNGYGGDSPLARGGYPLAVNSAGGGASLFGPGGNANAAGVLGSGGGSKSGGGSSQKGGDGYALIFWEGKNA